MGSQTHPEHGQRLVSTAMIPPPVSAPPAPPPPPGGRRITADQEIRTAALAAAARITGGIQLAPPRDSVRDLEQTTVGMAERLAEWIGSGVYDWMSEANPDNEAPGEATNRG